MNFYNLSAKRNDFSVALCPARINKRREFCRMRARKCDCQKDLPNSGRAIPITGKNPSNTPMLEDPREYRENSRSASPERARSEPKSGLRLEADEAFRKSKMTPGKFTSRTLFRYLLNVRALFSDLNAITVSIRQGRFDELLGTLPRLCSRRRCLRFCVPQCNEISRSVR